MRTAWRDDDPPDQEGFPCDVCGQGEYDCICPVCPECECQGNLSCYRDNLLYLLPSAFDWRPSLAGEGHGLVRSLAQVALRTDMDRQIWEEDQQWEGYTQEWADDHLSRGEIS